MDLLYAEPWHGGSHRRWIEGYRQHSRLKIGVLGLAPRHWKWRMAGAAGQLARQAVQEGLRPKAILASDMLHLPAFLGHCWSLDPRLLLAESGFPGHGPSGAQQRIPVHLFFHENQLTHPVSPKDRGPREDRMPAWLNVDSCRVADRIWFNSAYHLKAFFGALPDYLNQLPEQGGFNAGALGVLQAKSGVLPLGMDWPQCLESQDRCKPSSGNGSKVPQGSRCWNTANPILLWNHRWTFDKNPGLWARTLIDLSLRHAFRVVLLGPAGSDPQLLQWRGRLAEALGPRLLHAGAVSPQAYADWLYRADILPVCSRHDFFGQSVVEALHAGLLPLLPDALAYPEHLPPQHPAWWRYAPGGFAEALEALLLRWPQAVAEQAQVYPTLKAHLEARYSWPLLAPQYDARFGTGA